MRQRPYTLCRIVVNGLVGLLLLAGCSTERIVATTAGTQYTGFSKTPTEEVVKPPAVPMEAAKAAPPEEEAASAKAPKDKNLIEAPPTMVAKADEAEIAARKAREAVQKQLADIYFAFDKWALTAEGKKYLTESAEALKQVPTAKLSIEGHCDERGSREYNLVLGEKRAKEAQRFLSGLGVTNTMSVTSYGKERPVCTEHDESCYWKNRRAHLVLEEGD
jgi:peptidoglycan-associated lipoprotein